MFFKHSLLINSKDDFAKTAKLKQKIRRDCKIVVIRSYNLTHMYKHKLHITYYIYQHVFNWKLYTLNCRCNREGYLISLLSQTEPLSLRENAR